MPTLKILIGLPCSGKTVYALSSEGVILHMDDIRKAVTGTYRISKDHRPLYYKVCQEAIRHHLSLGLDVVLDGTMLSKEARAPYIRIAKQTNAAVQAVWFDPPFDVLSSRLAKRNAEVEADRRISIGYIQRMARNHLHMPLIEEGFDAIEQVIDFHLF